MNNFTIIGLGQVEYVEGGGNSFSDDANAGRIKVRMDSDGMKTIEELEYAFPLIPKSLHILPKVGEGVLVFNSRSGESDSQRYYVGPVISQPQFNTKCDFNNGRGNAVSLLSDKKALSEKPLKAISKAGELVKGAFPTNDDVALLGRGQEDVICRYKPDKGISEVDIRAGIRLEPTNTNVDFVKGNVVFNNYNPAYIQVKYQKGGVCGLKETPYDNDTNSYESPEIREAESVVNIVADKFNFVSHKANFNEAVNDPEQGVREEDIDYVMSQLHRGVYGDELITLLKLMVKAIFEHQHPFSMMPPTIGGTVLTQLVDYPYDKLLSENFRIS
jgi:hypothetical protein